MDYPNTFPSASSSDGAYHQYRSHSEHSLQRRASLHSYSPHSQSPYPTAMTPTTPTGYYSPHGDPSRRDYPMPSRTYRPLAPAPHPGTATSPYAPGPIPPFSHPSGLYPPTQTPISPTPSYMSLAISTPPTSPHRSRARPDTNSNDRIAEIMSINNLVDGEERPRSN
ncbi:hypothetical protein ABW19_dt0202540 [Dactylella cylindrospora]|nr:hypothetical protein ABW19_dt0202540 [Dactylella cylindrospora]